MKLRKNCKSRAPRKARISNGTITAYEELATGRDEIEPMESGIGAGDVSGRLGKMAKFQFGPSG